MNIKIDGSPLKLEDISKFSNNNSSVEVSPSVYKRLKKVRNFVEDKIKSGESYYGINTGFGLLADKHISFEDLAKLQENLIMSHAVGVGNSLPVKDVRLMMLLRANILAMGYSGVRPEILDILLQMINKNVIPLVPAKGSVGASGDLAPLAHLALTMIGKGHAYYQGELVSSENALGEAGLKPVRLEAKEGIALINGTQMMLALAARAVLKFDNLIKVADIVGALSIEGDRASLSPFDERIHKLRPHPGQLSTAENIRKLTGESGIIASHKNCKRVQDPYSFRCIPQVHGAVKDAYSYVRSVVERELASCTDNPLIFVDDDEIISGGNFHGEPLAFATDMLAIAAAELGSISERRLAILLMPIANEINARSLVKNSGLNSGLMPAHVSVSALVSENKTLSHPSSVDSIPTFGGQEDHVSMGAYSARKALSVLENLETILAIEIMAACQAIDFQRENGLPGVGTLAVYNLVRKSVLPIDEDREYRIDINTCERLVRSGEIVSVAENICGKLKL